MRILGIESSCDETAIALVTGSGEALTVEKSIVLSQIQTHEQYGGVVPEVAAREHLEAMLPMLSRELPFDGAQIDAIAVTAGPGLAPALRVGVQTAKTLAWAWQKPLVPICHLEGHVYAAWLSASEGRVTGFGGPPALDEAAEEKTGVKPGRTRPEFPALCLIVSGGHTELVLMTSHGEFRRLGETQDDAAGEAFDKVAKMLGLPYPGGPHLARLAQEGQPTAFSFPRAMLGSGDYNFSFSGLKTAVLYTLKKLESPNLADIAASFQEAVVDVLVQKTIQAASEYQPKSIILAGGVAANLELRSRLKVAAEGIGTPLFVPAMPYAMDNAAMIAAAGYFRAQNPKNFVDPLTLKADPNLDIL
jgi:N6-L-threonylcarbamoyladenine synthase